jgi:hypothetical protein
MSSDRHNIKSGSSAWGGNLLAETAFPPVVVNRTRGLLELMNEFEARLTLLRFRTGCPTLCDAPIFCHRIFVAILAASPACIF